MAIIYQPVVHAASGPYRGAALVGTHSAVIGWTFDDLTLRDNLLGFAIRRTDLDPETGEVMRLDWLGGFKRFADSDDGRADDVDSLEAPFQRFRWNDYTLKSTRAYRYEVFPMRMYDHYKSRYYIDRFNDKNKAIKKENKQRKAQGLDPKPLKAMDIHLKNDKSWSRTAFDPGSSRHKFRDRIVFAGG
jgi:hypothetical protein